MAKLKTKIDPHVERAADGLTPVIGFLLGMKQANGDIRTDIGIAQEAFLIRSIKDLRRAQDYLYEAARHET